MNPNILVPPINQSDIDLIVLVPLTPQTGIQPFTTPIFPSDIPTPVTIPSMGESALGIHQQLSPSPISMAPTNAANSFFVGNNNDQKILNRTIPIILSPHQLPRNQAILKQTIPMIPSLHQPPRYRAILNQTTPTIPSPHQSPRNQAILNRSVPIIPAPHPMMQSNGSTGADSLGVPRSLTSNNAVPPQMAQTLPLSASRSTFAALSAISGSPINVKDVDGFVGPNRNQRLNQNPNSQQHLVEHSKSKEKKYPLHSSSVANTAALANAFAEPPSTTTSMPPSTTTSMNRPQRRLRGAPIINAFEEPNEINECRCSICDKRFARQSQLRQHLKVHSKERPFHCPYAEICNKKFSQKHSLTDHIRTHTGEKPFECDFCNKRFKIKSNMKVHRRIHTGEKPYECPLCYKRFSSKSGLNAHVKRCSLSRESKRKSLGLA